MEKLQFPKYLELIQSDPKIFNNKQLSKLNYIGQKYGNNFKEFISDYPKHNNLKSSRSYDFRLSTLELQKFLISGVFIKEQNQVLYLPNEANEDYMKNEKEDQNTNSNIKETNNELYNLNEQEKIDLKAEIQPLLNEYNENKKKEKEKLEKNIDEDEACEFFGYETQIYPDTFAASYLNLYSNDIPVLITSDSMLYALHVFFDNWLQKQEEITLIPLFTRISNIFLENLYSISSNKKNYNYLRDLEVYFMVNFIILQLNYEVPEKINNKAQVIFPKEDIINELLNYDYDNIDDVFENELKLGYSDLEYLSQEKINQFKNYIDSQNLNRNQYEIHYILNKSPKFKKIINEFKDSDINFEIQFKFGGEEIFNQIIQKISKKEDFIFNLAGKEIKYDGSLFKPRGHYTKSMKLKLFYTSFIWLTNVLFNLENENDLILSILICKITENNMSNLIKLQEFFEKIVGESKGFTIFSFLNFINSTNIIPKIENRNELFNYIIENAEKIKDCFKFELKNYELKNSTKSLEMKIIGKGNQVDNEIINKLVYNNIKDSNNNIIPRKLPSIFDLIYVIFDNDSIKDEIIKRMNSKTIPQRDGFNYLPYLDALNCEYRNFDIKTPINNLYIQHLKMLKALSKKTKFIEKSDKIKIDLNKWMKKQAQAQIASYSELRHDNMLYVEEPTYETACLIPEIMVEPINEFWLEMLTYIKMIRNIITEQDEKDLEILNNFENVIKKFIIFIDNFLNNEKYEAANEEIYNFLRCIVTMTDFGSGEPSWDGWYINLYHDKDEAIEYKPILASIFTAEDDEIGKGGIVNIGTGKVQLVYTIFDNKIFIGPCYSAYEIISEYGERINDEEWKERVERGNSLNFN